MAVESSASSPTIAPLQDRVAIVTGASRGIGKEIALHLASLGAKVIVNYTSNPTLAQQVVTQINSSHGTDQTRAFAVRADVSDQAQVEALFDAAEQAFCAQPNIVVTTAGILDPTYPSIAETTLEGFDNMISVNVRGTFLCIQAAAKRVKRGGGGRIVTFSSSLTGVFRPGYGVYTASKAAVEAMTKILAKELKGTRITANCVAPGPIATELFLAGADEKRIQGAIDASPMQRLGEPKDVAPLVGFLAGDSAEWVNGQIIRVNGGFV
ncbi:NADPH-dependent aldehyde reductase-like protein, chloroplastic [Amaranthus tricolor]|uniref:NADPH-dependent aldehyde reductase-like protein, chloroplastic n=1 Tax=Amaranthus tricolor TaxID=29722 RepID=UPI002587C691|nr:NADPH-dependent aldehyde reductase-like protein, chloroplastic [Amaranthus tricolor]